MNRPAPSNETQRQRAFRSLAVARGRSLARQPDADDAYQQARQIAQQAVSDSSDPLEQQFAVQLQHIVDTDHRRHQRVADTAEFPAAVEM